MGVLQGDVRLPDPAGAQDRGLGAGPHRPQPRRPVRPACSPSPTASSSSSRKTSFPSHVDKLFFLLAPAIAVGTATLAFAVVPFGPTTRGRRRCSRWPQTTAEDTPKIADTRSSRTEVEALQRHLPVRHRPARRHRHPVHLRRHQPGGVRHHPGRLVVQQQVQLPRRPALQRPVISYEIPMGLSILGVVLLTGSLNLERIIDDQARPRLEHSSISRWRSCCS